MFLVALIDEHGARYDGAPTDEATARAAFSQQVVTSRFIRAELWQGAVDAGGWHDVALVESKGAAL